MSQHLARQRIQWLVVVTVAMGSCGAAPVVGQRPDTVMRLEAPPLRGTITRTSKQGLEMEAGETVSTPEIERVMFGDEPAALRQAKEALANGNVEQAARALERVEADEIDRELVQAEWAFVQAACAAQQAIEQRKDHAAAAKQMLNFIKAHKDTFHFYDAAESLGHLAVAMGRLDSASKYFGQLEKAPWPKTRFRGAVLSAEALRALGPNQLEAVLERYDRIAEAEVSGPEAQRQRQIAILGRATVRAELGKADDALAEIEAIIANTDAADAALLGRAYNALGAYHRGKQESTDAVLAYLHVDLLFPAEPEVHAEALYYLGQLWPREGKPDRGIDAANRLKTNYAGSIWAQKTNS
ncbi:MAG: hypothetical protein AAGF97_09245 [Planctomycetota bacterium]